MIDLKTRTAAIAELKEGTPSHEVIKKYHLPYQAIGAWIRLGYLDKYQPAQGTDNGTTPSPSISLLDRMAALEKRFDILATHTAQFINLINRIAKEVGIALEDSK